MRRYAAIGIPLLLGAGLSILGWFNALAGAALLALASVWTLLLIPAVTARLPRITWEPGGVAGGAAIRFQRAPGPARKRLRAEALALAAEIHEYIATSPAPNAVDEAEHNAMRAAMDQVPRDDEAARSAIWHDYTARSGERRQRDEQAFARRFGGRVRHTLNEFELLGLLTERDRMFMEWQSGGGGHANLASSLDALARRL